MDTANRFLPTQRVPGMFIIWKRFPTPPNDDQHFSVKIMAEACHNTILATKVRQGEDTTLEGNDRSIILSTVTVPHYFYHFQANLLDISIEFSSVHSKQF